MESGRVFGVGPGVFIVAFIWSFAVFIFLAISRTKTIGATTGGLATIFVLAVVTIILFVIPREQLDTSENDEFEIFDKLFYWRVALVVFMGISFIGGLTCVFVTVWMEPVFAKPLKQSKQWTISMSGQ
ncbi:transmembrane protein 218-like [Limulus polyphemus]|uniref:Transmembrane protein 218 n=1 Tax=Limulus polyphemus TaxID=6850 RepID=A0ABM1BW30_LIMPO|nr:transmembrane protein 218-like [Limulus polyphemus]